MSAILHPVAVATVAARQRITSVIRTVRWIVGLFTRTHFMMAKPLPRMPLGTKIGLPTALAPDGTTAFGWRVADALPPPQRG